ncbi:MAG: alpha/beta fold hydrolase, partial [Nocardioidaceae bacterium]
MQLPGSFAQVSLPDGRTLDYWEGGDPDGSPVLFQPGTPSCRIQGMHGHEAALTTGVRLIAVSRPGYGASSTTPPGLASVGRDAGLLADALGLDEYAVLGVSGGGPYAVACGLADPERVRHVGVGAGVGHWPEIEIPTPADEGERRLLAVGAAGHVEPATAGFVAIAQREFEPLLALDDEAMLDEFFAGAPAGDVDRDSTTFRAIWAADLREGLHSYDGYVRDNLSWGMPWDIELGAVSV